MSLCQINTVQNSRLIPGLHFGDLEALKGVHGPVKMSARQSYTVPQVIIFEPFVLDARKIQGMLFNIRCLSSLKLKDHSCIFANL